MSRDDLVLIVPCHNEATRLDSRAFLDFLAARPDVRVILVDDGSTDGTWGLLERLASAEPERIELVRLPANSGKGEAVRLGMLQAFQSRPRLVGFWDADLATPLDAVDDFLALLEKRSDIDVVIGSRVMLLGRDIRRLDWRHYVGRASATLISLELGVPVYDTQCGAKIFRSTGPIEAVFAAPFRSRWLFDVELLARYLDQPVGQDEPDRLARIYELALSRWHHKAGSRLRWYDYPRGLVDLVRIHLARRR